jgi:hypothetical protein
MAVEDKVESHGSTEPVTRRLDCIYDDEPLGFEKDPMSETPKMQAQDPLGEIDIGDGLVKWPTYISANITPSLKEKLVLLLKEFKDCFAWDYNEMFGLSREFKDCFAWNYNEMSGATPERIQRLLCQPIF